MGKAVHNHIRTRVLEIDLLNPTRHAYKASRSTETTLAELIGILQNSFGEKETAVCAFIDIEGAFDNTSYEAVRKALEIRGVMAHCQDGCENC